MLGEDVGMMTMITTGTWAFTWGKRLDVKCNTEAQTKLYCIFWRILAEDFVCLLKVEEQKWDTATVYWGTEISVRETEQTRKSKTVLHWDCCGASRVSCRKKKKLQKQFNIILNTIRHQHFMIMNQQCRLKVLVWV